MKNPGELTSMPDINQFVTPKEAAELLGFASVVSVRNLIYKGKLECRRFGRSILIPRRAIAEYVRRTRGMTLHDPRRTIVLPK